MMTSFIYSVLILILFSQLLTGSSIDVKCQTPDSLCLNAKAPALSKFIAEAIPQIGVEKLNPLIIDFWNINEKDLKFDMKNIHIHSMKNVIVDNVSIDATSRVVRILYHSNFTMNCAYNASGSLLSKPVFGEGQYNLSLDNVLLDVTIPFDIIKDADGKHVVDLKSYQFTHDVRDGAEFYLENLYNGDKHLSDDMHQTLKENWKAITEHYGKSFFSHINDIIFASLRNYMLSKPLDTIVLN